jgi:hypothetical protein
MSTTLPGSATPWRDLVLFAHLIPVCQHFVADGINIDGYEPLGISRSDAFEAHMTRRSVEHYDQSHDKYLQARRVFVAFLRTHPTNALWRGGSKYQVLQRQALGGHCFDSISYISTPTTTNSSGSDHNDSWEFIMCLMRNIVCHEESFTWQWLRQLVGQSLAFFGSHQAISDMILVYYTTVVVARMLLSDCQPHFASLLLMIVDQVFTCVHWRVRRLCSYRMLLLTTTTRLPPTTTTRLPR